MMRRKLPIIIVATVILVLALSGVLYAQDPPVQLPGSGWWSAEQLQNVGTGDATIQGTAYDLTNAAEHGLCSNITIPQGGAVTLVPEQFSSTTCFENANNFAGSAIVSSDEPLVAVVNVTNREVPGVIGASGGLAAGIYEGTDGTETDTTLNFPLFKKNFNNKTTTHYIQNAGSSTATIDAEFFPSGGGASVQASFSNIAPGQSVAIIPPSSIPSNTFGSLVVSSSQNLAGTATEYTTGSSVAKTLKAAKSFIASDFDSTLYVPAFKKDYFNRSSALLIQADAAVSGDITFTCVDSGTGDSGPTCNVGQQVNVPFNIAGAGESFDAFAFAPVLNSLPEGLYSAEISVTGGNVVATIDETGFSGGSDPSIPSPNRDTTSAAIPASKAATRWSCPTVKERFAGNTSAPTIFPIESGTTTVDVTYSVAGSESGAYVGQTFQIPDLTTTAGQSIVLFDTPYNQGDGILPKDTGLNTGVLVEADKNIVVIVNENVHFAFPSVQQDAKQYNCFPLQ